MLVSDGAGMPSPGTGGTHIPETELVHAARGTLPDLAAMSRADLLSAASDAGAQGGCIGCITESRGTASEVGIAIFDPGRGCCHVFQVVDSPRYTISNALLHKHQVLAVVFNEASLTDHHHSKAALHLLCNYTTDQLIPVPRERFNSEEGMRSIAEFSLGANLSNVQFQLDQKYYALASVAALFSHVAGAMQMAPRSICFQVQQPESFMLVDQQTAKALELVAPIGPKNSATLLLAIDRTRTLMGRRFLKNSILQPLREEALILERHVSIDALTARLDVFQGVQAALGSLPDVDQLINGLMRSPKTENARTPERNVQLVLMVEDLLAHLQGLAGLFEAGAWPEAIQRIVTTIKSPRLSELAESFGAVLSEDTALKRRAYVSQSMRCYAVKAGVDVLLDVARKTLKETTDDVYEFCEAFSKTFQLSLKVKYTPDKGFFLLVAKVPDQAPPESLFIQSESREHYQASTLELLKLNQRVRESLEEIFLISDKALEGLLAAGRERVGELYAISEALGYLDFICSATDYSASVLTVRPEFGDSLAVKNGRNVILEKAGACVPNDFFCGSGHEFVAIAGVNMSGKTTYLKTIALLQIMAQIGYRVPCDFGRFAVRDALFSRMGSDDDLRSNSSSFLKELKEIANCLGHATASSLVLIDELGRGTSISDGMALAAAISEQLIRCRCFAFFLSHFHRLLQYLCSFPSVSTLHLGTLEAAGSFSYTYRVAPGLHTIQDYGIKLAEHLGISSDFLCEARRIKAALESKEEVCDEARLMVARRIQKRKLIYKTAALLRDAGLSAEAIEAIRANFVTGLEDISRA